MKKIRFEHEHRRKHFQFFNKMDQPHFNVCAEVDIRRLLPHLKPRGLPFMPTVAYIVSDVANSIPEFRWRIRGDDVVEHEVVNPSFAVATDVADVFSFCEVKFQRPYGAFIEEARRRMEIMRTAPVFEDDQGDDYLFLSSLPWVAFTSIAHPMHYSPVDSVPRILWGKFYRRGDETPMPLSVQAHHAVVDGRHVGQFFELLQRKLYTPEESLDLGNL